MTDSLAGRLGLGDHELVAFVGAGGKTTLMFSLAEELTAMGSRVVVSTTTRLGADQLPGGAVRCGRLDLGSALDALTADPLVLWGQSDGHKVAGPSPGTIDELFATSAVDAVLVEADGARGRPLKAPDVHEPVVPSSATTVVVVAGLAAIGRPIATMHRPGLLAKLLDRPEESPIRPEDVAAVVAHEHGGDARAPAGARVVVALTADDGAGAGVASLLEGIDRIDRVVPIPRN